MTKKQEKGIHLLMDKKTVNQVVRKLCGELLGKGLYRDVYVFKQFPDCVIKIERDMNTGIFANVAEWRNYNNNYGWDFLGKWLAPCVTINQTGQVMVQERVNWDGKKRKDYPKYIPAMLTDLKLKNFGWIKDQFVCCDYSYMPVCVININTKARMKYAKWWGTLK